MNPSHELEAALAELREQHRRLEAPAHLGLSLRAATRSRKSQWLSRRWIWPMAAALLIGVVP